MSSTKSILRITLVSGILLSIAAGVYAPLNQDEGWYLIAARRISEGRVPYRDFAFTQGPVTPYVYRLAKPLVDAWGIAGGRVFTLLLGWGSILLTVWTVYRVRRKEDPLFPTGVALILLSLNTFHAQYLATVKTYPLAALWLAAGLGCLFIFLRKKRRSALIACGVFLALAAGTRLSLALFIPSILLELTVRRKQLESPAWMLFAGSAAVALACLFVPFLLIAPEGMGFGLIEFHTSRETGNRLLLTAAFFSRFLLAYLPIVLAALPLCIRRFRWQPGVPGVLGGVILVTLLHAGSPFPYDDYQAALIPALVLVVALQLPDVIVSQDFRRQALTGLALFAAVYAGVAPQWQQWFSQGRDRIWWHTTTRPSIRLLIEVAGYVQKQAPNEDVLFTTDPYLAIEAGMDVPGGLEMGPFSFFPDMETERAERLHVLNTELTLQLIASTPSTVAAFSDYGFAIQNPELLPVTDDVRSGIMETVKTHYQETSKIPNFGQAKTTLRIYTVKALDAAN